MENYKFLLQNLLIAIMQCSLKAKTVVNALCLHG